MNGQDVLFTGSLHGSGNILIAAIPGNPRDANGVRFRDTASDFSGNVEVQAGAKFELQVAVAGFSPLGTGSMTLDAGTFINTTTGGTFPIINIRNTTVGPLNITLGNAVKVAGTGSVLLNLIGPPNVTTTMGTLDVGGVGLTQTIDASSATAGNVETLIFGAVTAEGGTVTFSAGIPGNTNYTAPDSISLGADHGIGANQSCRRGCYYRNGYFNRRKQSYRNDHRQFRHPGRERRAQRHHRLERRGRHGEIYRREPHQPCRDCDSFGRRHLQYWRLLRNARRADLIGRDDHGENRPGHSASILQFANSSAADLDGLP